MFKRMKNASLRASALVALCATTLLAVAPESPVADAAQQGELALVRSLLRGGADVNAGQGDGTTGLHWAAMNGDVEMIQLMIYAGANRESTTRLGAYTPLHLASKGGHFAAVGVLLESGSNPSALTGLGLTPLHFAAASGSVKAVNALITAGAELDAQETANGQTPLVFAAAGGRLEAVEALIAAGVDLTVTTNVVDFDARGKEDSGARESRQELKAAIYKAEAQARGEWVEEEDDEFATQTDTPAGQEPTQREAKDRAERNTNTTSSSFSSSTARAEQEVDRDPLDSTQGQTEKDAEVGADSREEAGSISYDEGPNAAAKAANLAAQKQSLSFSQLVGRQGGTTALHYAVRQGHFEVAKTLLNAGSSIDRRSEGDASTPLLIATINGHYDLASYLLERGADPNLHSEDGVSPVYATIANRWAAKTLYPQPTAFRQQEHGYLELMEELLLAGADPNARVATHIWYASFNFDLLGVNFMGATPFWRAAKALDIPAMELLVAHGADPSMPTQKPPERRRRRSDDDDEEEKEDPSGLPPVEVGGLGIPPIVAAAGYGYGRSRTGNSHQHAPDSWLTAAKYLVEVTGSDVNARDHDGFSAMHFAAARGDNELINYLVSKGADPTFVARTGQTTVDLANGPIQRVQPFFETIALLEGMGAINNHKCLSC
jgi:ankyrin repeat protein